MQPRSLDEARRLLPHIGFAVYAYEPGGAVVLELHNHGEVAVSFTAPTEREAWEQVFPGLLFDPAPLPADEPELCPDVERYNRGECCGGGCSALPEPATDFFD
ncbi:MAG: hypothetical protein WAP03_19225 [Methylorubrum rhodinum]|uniref:hypothetical protein n=1 Tax=Methylorubrum rhodinum TaxID=29428 RepID=UPI003BAF8B3E